MKWASVLLTILLAGFWVQPVMSQTMPSFPHLTVSGNAKLEIKPNKVDMSFQVLAYESTSEQALMSQAKISEQVFELFRSMSLDMSNITADNIQKDTVRLRNQNSYQPQDILGYEVKRRFDVELLDLDKFEALANGLLKIDGVSQFNFGFGHTQESKFANQLAKKAGKDAKQKAKNLAAGMGVDLKGVFAVYEESGFSQLKGMRMTEVKSLEMSASNMRGSLNFNPPQNIERTLRIKVIYKIED